MLSNKNKTHKKNKNRLCSKACDKRMFLRIEKCNSNCENLVGHTCVTELFESQTTMVAKTSNFFS